MPTTFSYLNQLQAKVLSFFLIIYIFFHFQATKEENQTMDHPSPLKSTNFYKKSNVNQRKLRKYSVKDSIFEAEDIFLPKRSKISNNVKPEKKIIEPKLEVKEELEESFEVRYHIRRRQLKVESAAVTI